MGFIISREVNIFVAEVKLYLSEQVCYIKEQKDVSRKRKNKTTIGAGSYTFIVSSIDIFSLLTEWCTRNSPL